MLFHFHSSQRKARAGCVNQNLGTQKQFSGAEALENCGILRHGSSRALIRNPRADIELVDAASSSVGTQIWRCWVDGRRVCAEFVWILHCGRPLRGSAFVQNDSARAVGMFGEMQILRCGLDDTATRLPQDDSAFSFPLKPEEGESWLRQSKPGNSEAIFRG